MNIDGVNNGIVIDHIKAGKSMSIYQLLGLENLKCSVAIIQNASSAKYGKKDIIKIDENIHLDFNMLGYVDPNITVNIIKDSKLEKKYHLALPNELSDVIKCKNPRCITSIEHDIIHKFKLVDKEKHLYRCVYCDSLHCGK